MFSALWKRQRLLLLLCVFLVLLSVDTARRDRQAFRVMTFFGVRTVSRNTTSFFPPLAGGCPGSVLPAPAGGGANFSTDLLSDVQIVLKTGAADREKTRVFLSTFGSCISNVLICSDAEDVVDGHIVHDVLADLPPSYADNNPDWAAYSAQRAALANGQEIDKSNGGWRLDRFKFLPMVEKAFELAPAAKWYVFIEADMYYFWDTLFRVLSPLDPQQYHYLGVATPGSHGRWFAYGGGGMVLSGRLVRSLLKDGQRRVSAKPRYEALAKKDCCGDAVLAYVIYRELGIRLESLYPTFSGEMVQWLNVTKDKWCVPLLGVHRVDSEQMRRLWQWERCRPYTEDPITYATLLDFALTPLLEANPKMNWNNGANGALPEENAAHGSSDSCQLACANNATCLQYSYSKGTCHVADFVMAGGPEKDEAANACSGWDLKSLQKLGYSPNQDPATYCSQPRWLVPKVTYGNDHVQ